MKHCPACNHCVGFEKDDEDPDDDACDEMGRHRFCIRHEHTDYDGDDD